MEKVINLLGDMPIFSGFDQWTLHYLAGLAERKNYEPNDWLFHESTPRQWFGVVERGEVRIVRGLHGQQTSLAILREGGVLSEGFLLDDLPHSASCFTREGATVVQFSRQAIDQARMDRPDIFYGIVARVAQIISDRLRYAAERMAGHDTSYLKGKIRREKDLLGVREVPIHAYYGIQTLRAIENFPISGIKLSSFQHFLNALAYVKKSCALANCELGVLDKNKADAIAAACDEVLDGKLNNQFVVDMVQGGAGTSTNMNINEVIANRALELLGHEKGDYRHIHPNDHVNLSQSTNDAYPTAIRLAVNLMLKDVLGAMNELKTALEEKEQEFADVLKMGRTQLQDAVPMTLGQEFGAYAVMIGEDIERLREAGDLLKEINLGATAIGTGINSPPGYADLVTIKLREVSGIPVVKSYNLVEATQDSGAYVQMSGTLKRIAVKLSKICNDLRLLSSGPRCGLQEIHLPPMQPGSSIMPGKVNPVIPEVVNQVCFDIIGNDVTITMAAEAGQLELNVMEPIIALNLFQNFMMLRNACVVLTSRCIRGILANREKCRSYVENSIGLVTALNPVIGYERSVAIAKEALDSGRSVRDLVMEKGWITQEALDDLLRPENMTHPRRIPNTETDGF
ncbi:MAG: aspartate ammonia-lyase [Acidobacteria bacterium]|nr:aspartate ammonia-lyase [Acidobacteriota bacterium]